MREGTCILGHDTAPEGRVWNGLALLMCPTCGLVWRKDFDLDEAHYVNIDVATSPQKLRDRKANSALRLRLMEATIPTMTGVCDLGSGEGTFLSVVRDRYGAIGIRGVEPGVEGARYAHALGIPTSNRKLEELREEDREGCNVFTMFHVIEHLENPLLSLGHIYTHMNAGDWLVVETPNVEAYTYKRSGYTHPLIYPEHLYYFSPTTLKAALERVGFSVLRIYKRDFLDGALSISECLVRLGLRKPRYTNSVQREGSVERVQKEKSSYMKDVVRFVLNRLVDLLGRKEYLYAIAQKQA